MNRLEALTTQQAGAWSEVVGGATCHDFYHLPQYHALAEQRGEGEARLFCYREGAYSIALPLLLRGPMRHPAFAGADLPSWQDATSVYGYAGPVASHEDIPEPVARGFCEALEIAFRDLQVVSVFSRLHPFMEQAPLLAGLGECPAVSRTVSIDLSLPPEVQYSKYSHQHRTRLNKLKRLGLTCVHDREGAYLDDFIEIYNQTMRRVGAGPDYFFPREYFEQLYLALGPRLHLFVALQENRPITAVLFVSCDGIAQYHLGGTRDEALALSPTRLVLDQARLWAMEEGCRVLHLGGGASSSPDDSLFRFKLGFSDRTHPFRLWRWIVFPERYDELCRLKNAWNDSNGVIAAPKYFPTYRSPVTPCVAVPAIAHAEETI